ncbi:hypothetical protein WICPIJ_006714 [Wickerhamomyces pijperi]|uniref:Uncharacterized protein n=1 Tax=Wickerhamomyces pijperi TaxID=599730 RepID=A0A9P8Q172_WICPI|nr:hypothetical protein WICPIJ_006714 [Wickerhamomyces pijperi]
MLLPLWRYQDGLESARSWLEDLQLFESSLYFEPPKAANFTRKMLNRVWQTPTSYKVLDIKFTIHDSQFTIDDLFFQKTYSLSESTSQNLPLNPESNFLNKATCFSAALRSEIIGKASKSDVTFLAISVATRPG